MREKEVDSLLRKLGFEDEKIRYSFTKFLKELKTKDKVIIDRLNNDLQRRSNFDYNKTKSASSHTKAVSKSADFTYCPISYSIRETYDLPSSSQLEYGTSNHKESCLSFIVNIESDFRNKELSIEKYEVTTTFLRHPNENFYDLEYLFRNHNWDGIETLFNSSLVYQDINKSKPFISKNQFLTGKLDFLFKDYKNSVFILEEKYTQSVEIPTQPYQNHLIQCLSYLYAFDGINADYAILVYWNKNAHKYLESLRYNLVGLHEAKREFMYWGGGVSCGYVPDNISKDLDYYEYQVYSRIPYKTFVIEKSAENKQILINQFLKFKEFNKSKVIKTPRIPLEKCWNCVAFPFCNHKSGKINNLEIPYNY